MDIGDQSFEREQLYIEECIKKSKENTGKKLKPIGYCYYCFEPVNKNQLFCDGNCATKFEIESKFKP